MTRKACLFKAMVFPVVMYGCESWTKWGRIDGFELWCWKRFLRVLWTARRSNQSILKEISPEYSLAGLILMVPYFDHLMWTHWKKPWCWERLKAGGEGDKREWDGWTASPTLRIWVWVGSGSNVQVSLVCMGLQKVGHDWATALTELNLWQSFIEMLKVRTPGKVMWVKRRMLC